MVDDANDSVHTASEVLDDIKQLVEENGTVSQILERMLVIYEGYLRFMCEGSVITERELHYVMDYLEYVGSDKNYKQFLYYLERAKSVIDLYDADSEAVTVTTMHTVKGLEYDSVYIVDACDDVVPSSSREEYLRKTFSKKEADEYVEQERRLFYVACTRAKKRLMITTLQGNHSRFIEEQLEETPYEVEDMVGEGIVIEETYDKEVAKRSEKDSKED